MIITNLTYTQNISISASIAEGLNNLFRVGLGALMDDDEDRLMNAVVFRSDIDARPLHVDALMHLGTEIGSRVGGAHAGAHLLVAGHSPMSELVFARLLGIPTLGWMRGKLTFVNLSKLEHLGVDLDATQYFGAHPDEVMFLPYDPDPSHREQVEKEGCWAVLRLCTQLGMISGRGVPDLVPT